jgi:hypothetical protein
MDEAGETVTSIKVGKDWKFKVEVSAGNEIPRSRRENAALMEKLFSQGLLGDPDDLDIREQYLLAQDIPNARAFIAIQKRKQAELEKNPPKVDYTSLFTDKDMASGISDFIDSLEYNSEARDFILQELGIPVSKTKTDTVETAPAQTVTSKADVKEVATLAPNKVTNNPAEQADKQEIAAAMIDQEKGADEQIDVTEEVTNEIPERR